MDLAGELRSTDYFAFVGFAKPTSATLVHEAPGCPRKSGKAIAFVWFWWHCAFNVVLNDVFTFLGLFYKTEFG